MNLRLKRLLIYVFDRMAEVCLGFYDKEEKSEYIDLAIRCYELASVVEDMMLKEYYLEGSSLSVLKDHRTYKENAMAFLHQAWVKEKKSEQAEFIFRMSEKSRAILLLENYQLSKVKEDRSPEKEALYKEYEKID